MRRLPPVVLAGAAVLIAGVLVGASVANVQGTPGQPPQTIGPVAPVATMLLVPDAPANAAVSSLENLDTRVQQATAEARADGAEISVRVLDRTTDQIISNGNNTPMPIASVAKLFIADDLLLRGPPLSPDERGALDVMLRSSDDSAAEVFWDRGGGSAIITRVVGRYGLTGTTTPYNGRWFNTLSTVGDLVRYYDMLLGGSGGLPLEQANVIIGNLSQSTPVGIDGYPQRFGIPDGLFGEPVAVKQGWMCCWNGANWMHMSTGVVGPERRYIVAIGSMHPTDEVTARNTITQAVKTMFPGGQI